MIFADMNPAAFWLIALPAGALIGALVTALVERWWLR